MVNKMHVQRVVVVFILLVLFGSMVFESCQSVVASIVNVTYEGDLLVSDNKTFTIQDSEFYLENGKITVQDSSTLIIRNSEFTADGAPWGNEIIVLEDQGKLIVENSTLISNEFYKIIVQNDAVLNISHSLFLSTLQNTRWDIQSFDEAKIHLNNSTITSGDTSDSSVIGPQGNSTVVIENSDIDGVYIWRNSTVSIKNSVMGFVQAGDMTDVNITDSEIRVIETARSNEEYAPTFFVQNSTVKWVEFRSNSSGRFTGSSVAEVEAYDNSNIMLIDSYAGSIVTHDAATVFVGWHLPLFGLVTMPYTWVSIIQTIITIAIVMIIIAVLVLLYRKRARRVQRENAYTHTRQDYPEHVRCPKCGKDVSMGGLKYRWCPHCRAKLEGT